MGEYDETVDIAEQLALIAKHARDARSAYYEMAKWIRARERGLHKIIGGLILQHAREDHKSAAGIDKDGTLRSLLTILNTGYMAKVAPEIKIEGSPSEIKISVRVY